MLPKPETTIAPPPPQTNQHQGLVPTPPPPPFPSRPPISQSTLFTPPPPPSPQPPPPSRSGGFPPQKANRTRTYPRKCQLACSFSFYGTLPCPRGGDWGPELHPPPPPGFYPSDGDPGWQGRSRPCGRPGGLGSVYVGMTGLLKAVMEPQTLRLVSAGKVHPPNFQDSFHLPAIGYCQNCQGRKSKDTQKAHTTEALLQSLMHVGLPVGNGALRGTAVTRGLLFMDRVNCLPHTHARARAQNMRRRSVEIAITELPYPQSN